MNKLLLVLLLLLLLLLNVVKANKNVQQRDLIGFINIPLLIYTILHVLI